MLQTVNPQSPTRSSAILGQPLSTHTTYDARDPPSEELTCLDARVVHIYRNPYAVFQSTNHVCRMTLGMMRLSH
jgi:hypothetical protein